MKKYIVTLTEGERNELAELTSKGKHSSQKVLNALILLNCDDGEFQTLCSVNEDVARILKIGMRRIDRVKKRFVTDGLDVALNGAKGSRVHSKKADGDFEARPVALSCGSPPEGFRRWSPGLLADQVVELNYVGSISRETVRRVLKKTKSNPGRRKGGQFRRNKTEVSPPAWKLCWMSTSGRTTRSFRSYAWTSPRSG